MTQNQNKSDCKIIKIKYILQVFDSSKNSRTFLSVKSLNIR